MTNDANQKILITMSILFDLYFRKKALCNLHKFFPTNAILFAELIMNVDGVAYVSTFSHLFQKKFNVSRETLNFYIAYKAY